MTYEESKAIFIEFKNKVNGTNFDDVVNNYEIIENHYKLGRRSVIIRYGMIGVEVTECVKKAYANACNVRIYDKEKQTYRNCNFFNEYDA